MNSVQRRVVFVIHYPVFGGPHNQAARLNGALERRGWCQTVLMPNEPGNAGERLLSAGVEVLQVQLGRLRAKPDLRLQLRMLGGFVPDVSRLRSIFQELHPDAVMLGGLVNVQAAIAARTRATPVVWQIVDTRSPGPLRYAVMPMVRTFAGAVLCTGRAVASRHPGALDLDDRLFVFFPPVDTDRFAPSDRARQRARSELGLAHDDIVVGSIGNINPQKGHRLFVRSAARLKKAWPKARFVVLGASYPQHAEYSMAVWTEAEQLGLALGRDLIVTDPGERVAELAPALDVFWLTSEPRSEGIPTVVGEAMSLALPVISTDVGSVHEAIGDEGAGFVLPRADPRLLADTTQRLIEDPASYDATATRARKRAVACFGVDACADIHVDAFERALRDASAGEASPRSRA